MAKVRAADFDERLSNMESNLLGRAYSATHESLNTLGSSAALNGFLGAPLRYQLRSMEAKSKLFLGVDTNEIKETLRDEKKNVWQKGAGVFGTVMRGIDHTSTASFAFSVLKYGTAASVAGVAAACSAGPAAVIAAGAVTAYCLKHYLGSDAGEQLEHGVGHKLNKSHQLLLKKFGAAKEASHEPHANPLHNLKHEHGHGAGHQTYAQTVKQDLMGLGNAIIAPHKAIQHAYYNGGYAMEQVSVKLMPIADQAYLKTTAAMDRMHQKATKVTGNILDNVAEAVVQPVGNFINQKATMVMGLFIDTAQNYGDGLQPVMVPVVNEKPRFKQRSVI
jgi:hypothetical protein